MTLHHLEQTFLLAELNLSRVQSIAVIIKSKDPLLVFKVGLEVKFYAPWLSWHLVEQRFWVLCSDFFQCVITAWRAGQFLLKKKRKKNLKPLRTVVMILFNDLSQTAFFLLQGQNLESHGI